MKLRYCQHCEQDVPMFNNEEYKQLSDIYKQCIKSIEEYRKTHETSLAETPFEELYQPLFEAYKQIAGIEPEYYPFEIIQRHYLARWKMYRHEAE